MHLQPVRAFMARPDPAREAQQVSRILNSGGDLQKRTRDPATEEVEHLNAMESPNQEINLSEHLKL